MSCQTCGALCPQCGGVVEEHVDSRGGGSRYCLDACGYYEELPPATKKPQRPRFQEKKRVRRDK